MEKENIQDFNGFKNDHPDVLTKKMVLQIDRKKTYVYRSIH